MGLTSVFCWRGFNPRAPRVGRSLEDHANAVQHNLFSTTCANLPYTSLYPSFFFSSIVKKLTRTRFKTCCANLPVFRALLEVRGITKIHKISGSSKSTYLFTPNDSTLCSRGCRSLYIRMLSVSGSIVSRSLARKTSYCTSSTRHSKTLYCTRCP